ncbi:MAG: thioredoxin domain-containing protein [Candidatus Yonathbacteria bacterium]|nr:thioredoxin domain-containing protein [Candidatus Yonathbacteria bacterium]
MEENNTLNREEVKKSSPAPINNYAIPLAIVIAGLSIAVAVYFGGGKAVKDASSSNKAQKTDFTPISERDHLMGNPNAKIIIAEYSDLECPYCKMFHTTMNKIMSEYGEGGEAAWVYRHFPIAELHSKAHREAEATECANKLGGNTKFWEYTNKIFSITPSNNGLNESELSKTAQAIGLDLKAFNECLSSGEMKGIVDQDMASGTKAGARGTPYSLIFVDKKVVGTIDGAQSYEQVKATIDEILK